VRPSGETARFDEYAAAKIPALRRLAFALCQDWHSADDLVQVTLTRLCVHWVKVAAADRPDAYVRSMLVREFARQRRTPWARRVSVAEQLPEIAASAADLEGLLDLRAAVASLPPRQRAVLVLRFFCDLSVEESAGVLGCTPGTVKSQTAKALATLRRTLDPASAPGDDLRPGVQNRRAARKVHDRA
jgi:RNA polymerase sigma-70 factor (sigma-E family)